jgi:sialate O-acetylesterase
MKVFCCIFFVFLTVPVFSQMHLSAIFSDHMILQRDKPVKIWGTANATEMVRVTIGKVLDSARADRDGKWMISLHPFAAGGPYILTIQTKKETRIFSDVLFGEVWLCSGQSNMEFKVRQAVNAKYEIHRANNPLIREVRIPNKLSYLPEPYIDSTQWIVSSPETVGEFTAVGFFFARDIYEKLHVPVGLIYDNWGGSQVESWISRNAMMSSGDLNDYARQMPGNWDETNEQVERKLVEGLTKNNNGAFPDANMKNIIKPGYVFSGWMPSAAPGDLDWIGLPAYRGDVCLEKDIWVDSIQTALPSVLSLGVNDARFHIYLNGVSLPNGNKKNILIIIPAKTWKEGKNVLLIEVRNPPVTDLSVLGIHGSPEQIYIDFEGERISLADEKWKMLPLLGKPHRFIQWMNSAGAIIYNAMIHPIIPISIQGVLWYQGEANTDRAFEYGKTFPLLIESWRKEWNDPFYFLFVQLAGFGSNESSNSGNKWAELREAQAKTLSLPKTGMAVTTDIGEPKDIHPKNKQEVGRRLAVIALNDVYHIPQISRGPLYQSVSFSNGKGILTFESAGMELMANNRYGALNGFEIAGPDRKFYFAHALIRDNQVIVSADSVNNPVAVRYGWSNAPADINLYNAAGFPAPPFRTDDWPGVTDSVRFFKK